MDTFYALPSDKPTIPGPNLSIYIRMDTNVKQLSPVEYEFELTATADELLPIIEQELRQHKSKITLKGFRKGKVPVAIVKKMYGKELAYGVAEKSIQERYESEILNSGNHEVLGQPKVTELDYEMDGDLRAVIRFGVRPEFEMQEVDGIEINKLVHNVGDEDIENEFEAIQLQHAEIEPSSEPVTADDIVTVDMQEMDAVAEVPIEDELRQDVELSLFDEKLQPDLRDALLGSSVGDTVRASITRQKGEVTENTVHFDVTVKEVKRRTVPERNDDLARKASNDRFDTLSELEEEIRKGLQAQWEQRSEQLFETSIIKELTDRHEFSVPESVIELYLDSFVDELKQRAGGSLPPGFDDQGYRDYRKDDAEHQARWMLIRDKIIKEQEFEITDEDKDAFFEESADAEGMSADILKKYYSSIPGLAGQLEQQLLNKKIFSYLKPKFSVTELDKEAYEKALEVDEPSDG